MAHLTEILTTLQESRCMADIYVVSQTPCLYGVQSLIIISNTDPE